MQTRHFLRLGVLQFLQLLQFVALQPSHAPQRRLLLFLPINYLGKVVKSLHNFMYLKHVMAPQLVLLCCY